MAYKVIDPKGVGYTGDSGVIIIPKDGILDDKLIDETYFRQEAIDGMVKDGRLKKTSEKVIAPENRKMPVAEIKAEKKSPKGSKKK